MQNRFARLFLTSLLTTAAPDAATANPVTSPDLRTPRPSGQLEVPPEGDEQ